MAFPPDVWNQLKNLTRDDLISALLRDGWYKDPTSKGATIGHIKEGSQRKRVVIHYHAHKTYGPKTLKGLLDDIGWNEDDLRRLKLIR